MPTNAGREGYRRIRQGQGYKWVPESAEARAEEYAEKRAALLAARNPKPPEPPAPPPGPLPTQYNPATYDQQLASQLSPGFQMPTPIQGQFPMQGQAPQIQQPGFGNQGGFNPNMGLFGSFAPSQGGMFSGLFGGQQ